MHLDRLLAARAAGKHLYDSFRRAPMGGFSSSRRGIRTARDKRNNRDREIGDDTTGWEPAAVVTLASSFRASLLSNPPSKLPKH
jgi:hypothetical protein